MIMLKWIKYRWARFKHMREMDAYIKKYDPLHAPSINVNIHAVFDYARSVGKPIDQLTEEEVKRFYIA